MPGAIEDAFAFHTRVSEAIAAKDADMAEKLIAQHLFSVVRHIESNLKVDLQQSTLSGYNLLQTDNDARKTKLK